MPIEMYARWSVKAETGKKPLQTHDIVFSLDDLGGVESLTRWLEVADNNAASLSRVMISRYSDTTYASDLLLNAAAALEGYHRDKYEEGKETKTWFTERIKKLVEDAGAIFEDLVPDTELFAKLLKDNRAPSLTTSAELQTAPPSKSFSDVLPVGS